MISRRGRIKNVLDELLESHGSDGQRIRNRIDQSSPINLYVACTFPHRKVMLEIGPIRKCYLPHDFIRPRIKGIDITVLSNQNPGRGEITLLLELQELDAIDVFITFAARVCEEMDRLQKPIDAVSTIISLMNRWKDFFASNSALLTEGRQTGLYGELHIMSRLYKEGVPLNKLVNAWTGSKRTNQDYEFGNASIEVKASAALETSQVKITNARQLDDTGLGLLLLSRVLFDARQGTKNTLPALIDHLRTAIAAHASEMSLDFEEKIILAKYLDRHAEYYSNRSYAERALEFYEVRKGFPRLLESDLPLGVTEASYEITLENCKPFKKSTEDVFKIMRKCCD